MGSLLSILLHWLLRKIAVLGWSNFIALIADTFQNLALLGLRLASIRIMTWQSELAC